MTKIMLVEDDNNLREIYEARLLAEGYTIVSASDGEAGLAMAMKEKPDLIICDVMMPKISGFDMLDILRSTPEIKNTKIIMMTALSQAEDKARAEKLGADRYLVKSQVTLEDVARVVSEVLNDEPAQDLGAPIAAAPMPEPTTQADTALPTEVSQPEQPTESIMPMSPTEPTDTTQETPAAPSEPVEAPDINVEDTSDTAPEAPGLPETPEVPSMDTTLPIASDPASHQPILPIDEPSDDTSQPSIVVTTVPDMPVATDQTTTQSLDDTATPMVIEPPILPIADEESASIPVSVPESPANPTDNVTSGPVEPTTPFLTEPIASDPASHQPMSQTEPSDTTQETPAAPSEPVEAPDIDVEDTSDTAPEAPGLPETPEVPSMDTTLPIASEETSLPPPTEQSAEQPAEQPEVVKSDNVQISGKKIISPINNLTSGSVDLNALLAQEEAKEAANGVPQAADNTIVQPDQATTGVNSGGSPSDIAL